MSDIRNIWNESDTNILCLCYLLKIKENIVEIILPHKKLSSIKMKYNNCKYLETGHGLSNVSKIHKRVWNLLN